MGTSPVVSRRMASGPSAVFPGRWRPGRARPSNLGDREKHYPDPVWTGRIARLGGRNPHGEPLFKPSWGWCTTHIGATPRYVQALNNWLLLRWFPPDEWGNSVLWYAPRYEDGAWSPSYAEEFHEDFPARGGYEIDFAFDEGQPFCLPFIEHRLRMFHRRARLEPVSARRRQDYATLDAEKQTVWQADYERFLEASRPFGDAPMVGGGSNAKAPKRAHPTMSDIAYQKLKHVHAGRMARLERLARESAA